MVGTPSSISWNYFRAQVIPRLSVVYFIVHLPLKECYGGERGCWRGTLARPKNTACIRPVDPDGNVTWVQTYHIQKMLPSLQYVNLLECKVVLPACLETLWKTGRICLNKRVMVRSMNHQGHICWPFSPTFQLWSQIASLIETNLSEVIGWDALALWHIVCFHLCRRIQ